MWRPWHASRPATVELSTPPLIATAIVFSGMGRRQRRNFSKMRDRINYGVEQRVDLLDGIGPAQRKADAGARPLGGEADREQHMRRLDRTARAGRSAGDGESTQIERDDERLALD